MEDLMAKFTTVAARPYDWLREWKGTHDKKLMGVSPMHFPEEIVHAAGLQPVVLQESDEPVTFGNTYIYPFFCAWTRSNLDLLVKEKLDLFDGLLFFDECLQVRSARIIAGNRIRFPYYRLVQPPCSLRSPSALAEVTETFEWLRSDMEQFVGHGITDQSLWESIMFYNKNRDLLRRLHELNRAKLGVLRAKEMLAIVQSSMIMPKEEHSELLEKLLPQLEGRESHPDGRVRLVLSGHLCLAPKTDLLDAIEDAGAVIVDDDLYTGYRYFAVDVPVNGNPMEALAKRYLTNFPPNPTRWDPDNDWAEYIIGMTKRSQAQGTIMLVVKHCELHHWYFAHIRRELMSAEIPHLVLETEHEMISLGPERTRIEAFLEMIRAANPVS
jgi:benzoyl-CoA reductase subunit C